MRPAVRPDPIHIGAGLKSDVVLRGLVGDGDAALQLSLKAATDGVHVAMQQGQVQADGRTVLAGQTLVVAMGTPLTFGSTRITLVQAEVRGAGAEFAAAAATAAATAPMQPADAPVPSQAGPLRALAASSAHRRQRAGCRIHRRAGLRQLDGAHAAHAREAGAAG
ncbi:MAG: hypothetical protein LH480_16120 [Rubrivivax sp.]|nr:hypothetical protein [Rubrivivax sp.]